MLATAFFLKNDEQQLSQSVTLEDTFFLKKILKITDYHFLKITLFSYFLQQMP